jgi:hypothetical protein
MKKLWIMGGALIFALFLCSLVVPLVNDTAYWEDSGNVYVETNACFPLQEYQVTICNEDNCMWNNNKWSSFNHIKFQHVAPGGYHIYIDARFLLHTEHWEYYLIVPEPRVY